MRYNYTFRLPTDTEKARVIGPLGVKTQAVSSAAESATMVLRIDDVIAASAEEQPLEMPPEMVGEW